MNDFNFDQPVDPGLYALCGISGYYKIPADPVHLARELALGVRQSEPEDIVRAAKLLGLRARILQGVSPERMQSVPFPALARLLDGTFVLIGRSAEAGMLRLIDPLTRIPTEVPIAEGLAQLQPFLILVQRKLGGPGRNPASNIFNLGWFVPSIWRYRKSLGQVMLASLFIQLFALATPMFFQVVTDKVLVHYSLSTLYVIVAGLVLVIFFDGILQWLRTYILTHTTNRIDVELGQRLFAHLLKLPIDYFESRPAGQTVARMQELEKIREFFTGHGLFLLLDLLFGSIFLAVLFSYSSKLALIVVLSLPVYFLIGVFVGPPLRAKINERFNRAALSQQFLVEAVIGMQTVKAAAVEPAMRSEWEQRLAAYVKTTFSAGLTAATGQGAIQFTNKLTTALIMLWGAEAVMAGELTVGALIAFNMIANHLTQPILRLSQIWQEFQQVGISVARLGDVFNAHPEYSNSAMANLPPPRGGIDFKHVRFRYPTSQQDVIKDFSLRIQPGEVIAIVGASGSGKSTIAKLVQRFHMPNEGQVLLDGIDLTQVDTGWLRRHIGVVLQENLLFNRSIHDNIALSNPAYSRERVMEVAQLAGAHEFISKLPTGYDTMIEERGTNLSGGQRQRIVIARALLTNPRILIFDEATSALDYESEAMIQRNMRRIVQGRTVIIIAHRLSTVRNANRIVGMHEGRIVEIGSHEQLLERPNGLYARLWKMQSAGVNT